MIIKDKSSCCEQFGFMTNDIIMGLQGKLGVPGLPGYPGRQGPKVRKTHIQHHITYQR